MRNAVLLEDVALSEAITISSSAYAVVSERGKIIKGRLNWRKVSQLTQLAHNSSTHTTLSLDSYPQSAFPRLVFEEV